MTEQAFLNRGRFNFTLDEACQEEARQRCLEAALQIWRLVEAYRDAFTLRRAQYGISYATYCAALVILQHTEKEYIGCLRFFWHALVEYQRGCNYGLKRPLRLLKSLMGRLETVMQEHNTEESEVADWHNLGGKKSPALLNQCTVIVLIHCAQNFKWAHLPLLTSSLLIWLQ